jgi:hypothetical protein
MELEFCGHGEALSEAGLTSAGQQLGVGLAEIWSVLQVETTGSGFFANRQPKILFERHIFSKRTKGKFDEEHPEISNPKAGGYSGGPTEYDRLAKAIKLDRNAALESASWGIGQVMGFNFPAGGFADVESMVKEMLISEDRQLSAMAGFIKNNALAARLQAKDWAGFAAGYNGENYKDNDYDTKLASAYAKLNKELPDTRIRAAQLYLTYAGFDPHGVDGVVGRNTTNAIKAFQTAKKLPKETGELDDMTFNALKAALDQA